MSDPMLKTSLIIFVGFLLIYLYDIFSKGIQSKKDYFELFAVPVKFLGMVIASSLFIVSIVGGTLFDIFNSIVPEEQTFELTVYSRDDDKPVDGANVYFICENQPLSIFNFKGEGKYKGTIKYSNKLEKAYFIAEKNNKYLGVKQFDLSEDVNNDDYPLFVESINRRYINLTHYSEKDTTITNDINFFTIESIDVFTNIRNGKVVLKPYRGDEVILQ